MEKIFFAPGNGGGLARFKIQDSMTLYGPVYIYIQNKFHLSQYCRLKSTLKLASHKNYAVFSFDLFADFGISLNDNLHILDFDVEADLVE